MSNWLNDWLDECGIECHTIVVEPLHVKKGDDLIINGYKLITNLYQEFSKVEQCGLFDVSNFYLDALNKYKDNYKCLTELVMVLNWKHWDHYKYNEELAELYAELYYSAHEYACENLKGEELNYYYMTTD
jgi:hypothetical protein